MLHVILKRSLTEGTAAHLNNLAVCADSLRGLNWRQLNTAHEVIAGLHVRDVAGQPTDWSLQDEVEQRGTVGLAWLTFRLPLEKYLRRAEIGDGYGRWLSDPPLRELVQRRPDDAPKILKLLDDRRLPAATAEDIAYLESLMDGDGHRTLSEGSL